MKDQNSSLTRISISIPSHLPPPPSASSPAKKNGAFVSLSGYKIWVLAAILLLAFWSMFTGSVSLKLSSSDLSDTAEFPAQDDLDILEVEEREKVVRKMWDVYTQSRRVRLPRFWQQAFEAAYELLSSEAPAVRDGAVREIAKLSLTTLALDPLPFQSTTSRNRRVSRQADKSKVVSPTHLF